MEVHDLPEFLRGGVRDQTTHVIVRFRSSRRSSLAKAKVRRSTVEEPSTSSIDEEGDEEESDEPDAHATHVLARAAHDTASVCSDPVPSLSLPSVDGGHSNNRSYPSSPRVTPAARRNSSTGILAETSPLALATAHVLLSPRNGAKRPARAPSPDMDAVYHGRAITPTIAELLGGVSPAGRPQLATRSSTPDSLARARMPRSLSALETYHRSSPLALDLPSRSKSVLDKPSAALGPTPARSQSLDLKDLTDGHRNDEVLHLYTLSTSTLLFHLLHSLWVASTLKQTQNAARLRTALHDVSHERTLDLTFGQLRNELLTSASLEEQFSVLQELQQGVVKYSTIRRLVWRDPDLIEVMRSFVRSYMKPSGPQQVSAAEDPEEALQRRQDELEMLALTLETLATCTQGTQRCPHKMKVLKRNKFECLKGLITEVMACPEVPAPYTLTCTRWLTDFRDLSSHAWENLPESELLRLVQDVTHTSTSCIYELLGAVSEFSWVGGGEHMSGQEESVISFTTLFQHAPVEAWLSYSVPQLLTLLHPEQDSQATGSDAALIHQYCSVLATLLHHSPRALQYCTSNYAEEIRYYVHESVVSYRLGASSPILPHTLKVVRSMTKLVRPKSSLRTR
ncbi:uncharacterized protein C12orf56 homolog [Penaeus chinensis]|uniref:uncharacterized protein C12orf56 homolog n=1 Tax=Penaeus chinensis TaxID=139456 RepID=UPI001FB7A5BB|nr:uncharacterized protein C12orf56 homolog [Penaeus chinensis]